MTNCAICGVDLPTAASEYGNVPGGPVVCLNDWTLYLDWQQRVHAVEAAAFAAFQSGGDEVQAMVIELADYLTYVEPDDVEADVLEQYDLLPAHVSPRNPPPPSMASVMAAMQPPVGPVVMDPDRSPQHREAAGW